METNLFGVYIDDGKLAEYAASTAMLDKFAGYISGATEAKRLRRANRRYCPVPRAGLCHPS